MRWFKPTSCRCLLPAGLLILLALVWATSSHAQADTQATPGKAAEIPVATLRDLATTLEDESKRTQLLGTIRALIAAEEKTERQEQTGNLGDRMLNYTAEAAREAQDALATTTSYFRGWPDLVAWIKNELDDPGSRARGLHEVMSFVAIFAAGWLCEFLLWRALTGTRRRFDGFAPGRSIARIFPVIARMLVDMIPLLAFFGAAYATALVVEPTRVVRAVSLNFVNAYLVARGLMALARLLLAPGSRSLRLLPLHDRIAAGLYGWTRRFIYTGVVGYFIIAAALLLGMPRRGSDTLLTILGVVLAGLAVVFVLRHRQPVATWLHQQASAASTRFGSAHLLSGLAVVWHVLAIAYIIGFFIVAAFRIEGGFSFMLRGTLLSLTIIIGSWLLLLGLRRLRQHLTPTAPTPGLPEQAFRRRFSFYAPAVAAVLRAAVLVATAVALFEAWGIGAFGWLQQPLGQRALGAALSIAVVLAVAVLVWEIASSAIERYLSRQDRDGSALQRSARERTLLPLLRKALFVFLSVMVTLITLSEIGVDIAPLLAGAGVVGLAIGFGAQKLVQDVITGIFMLVEDAISVGDVVNVAGVGGLVEDLSIRSIRLRDLAGNVHTVPFSSVETVTNMTKGFSYYVFDIGVSYREDTDRVSSVCTQLMDEMRQDAQFQTDILEPLEVLGVDQFGESAVVIKARVKTRPIRQWAVGREFNRRMKKRFDELGIEIPFPHRTLFLGNAEQRLRVDLEALQAPGGSTTSQPAKAEFPGQVPGEPGAQGATRGRGRRRPQRRNGAPKPRTGSFAPEDA
jgi:small-conductance mechanosensitive channel